MRSLEQHEIDQVSGGRANGAEPDYVFTFEGEPIEIVDRNNALFDLARATITGGAAGAFGGPVVAFGGALIGAAGAGLFIRMHTRRVSPKITIVELRRHRD